MSPTDTQTREQKLGLLDEPVEKVIKHGAFWFHTPEFAVVGGEDKEILVERMAFNGEHVSIQRKADLQRGEKYDAFYTEEELKRLPTERARLARERLALETAEGEEGGQPDLSTLEDAELVDWLMSTGEFDGRRKPNADEVVAAVGNDPELAGRVLEAEETAQGDAGMRKSVEEPLDKIIAGS
jgi:hypothetical protein